MSGKVEMLSVKELIEHKKSFRVAFYQRGFRWRQQQVLQLLDDLHGFQKTHKNPFYFLQALVVNENDNESGEYRVIDGQQRLTTLLLILQKMPQDWFPENSKVTVNHDKMKYDRSNTGKNSLNNESGALDAHFRCEATRLIFEYLKNLSKMSGKKLCSNLLESKFLFYNLKCELYEEEKIFNRLNSGKIYAKESELIKCVMLTPQIDEDKRLTDARAQEWDDIERELNNDAFFYFLANKKTPYLNDRIAHLLHIAGIVPDQNDNERFPMLKKAYEILSQNGASKSREELWKDICFTFYTLKAWFTSKDGWEYHAFGWQINRKDGKLPKDLSIDKDEMSNLWTEEFKKMSEGDKANIFIAKKTLAHNLLLLFNVAYCWRYKIRYNFAEHAKIDTWSLEHIHAQNQEQLSEKDFNVLGNLTYEGKELKYADYEEACSEENDPNGTIWLQNNLGDNYPADDNSLGNLVLLAKSDNSSLNNGFFNAKRSKINNCWIGKWIPDATRAVFNKSLPDLDLNLPYWGEPDRKVYVKFIEETIENFMDIKQEEKND